MPTVQLPETWVMIAPCGCVDGAMLAVVNGTIRCATADEAWKKFSPLKRDRDREERQGFRIEPRDERVALSDCAHDPKWGSGRCVLEVTR